MWYCRQKRLIANVSQQHNSHARHPWVMTWRRVLSSVSFKSMQDLSSMTEQQLELEEIDVDEVFSNIYIYEACTACVLIHVRISEMCDSEDAWLYKARTYLVLVYNM